MPPPTPATATTLPPSVAAKYPMAAPSGSSHGYIISYTAPTLGPDAIRDPLNPKSPLDPKSDYPLRTTVRHVDGFEETYEFNGRTPPEFSKGDFGTLVAENGFHEAQKDDFNKAMQQASTGIREESTGRGGRVVVMPDGTRVQVQDSAPTPPHVQVRADGSTMLIQADGTWNLVQDANGNIVYDPLKVAEFADHLNVSKEAVLTAIQNREVQASQENRAGRQQAFNESNANFQNNVTIQNQAGSQAATDLANVLHLGIDLPAQTAANERAANLARSNEAVQRMAAAINGEATANVSGNNAVSDAQWMLQHGATPAFMGQLGTISGNVNAGALPNFGAPGMAIPMPDLAALRGSAQADTRARIPDFATALAQSQAQPVARPDMGAFWNFYQGQRPYTNLYGGGVPLPYPTDIHPLLLQNPNMATIPYNPEPDPTTSPPYMGDVYYGGGLRAG